MLEGMAAAGAVVPALEERPDISGYEWLWLAFYDLSTCRAIGMSMGPIPWTAIHTYIEAEDMTPFEAKLVRRAVMRMDSIFMRHQHERAKQRQAKARSAKPGRR